MILDTIRLKVKVDLILLRQLRYLKGYLCKVYKRMMKMEKKKVFISGSRSFTNLPKDFKESIEWLVELESYEFLVGDCAGTDLLVQQLLYSMHCKDVTVYCSGNYPRNFNGSVVWHRNCLGFPKPKVEDEGLVEYYALKDIRMSRDCDKALVLWNGSSKATKNNIDRLKEMGKKVVLFNYGSE